MNSFRKLLKTLKTDKSILIQAHDFPDHDALVSAYGLARLLDTYGIESTVCYHGTIQSFSLNKAMQQLSIQAHSIEDLQHYTSAQIIAVDGIPTISSVGDIVILIDHHNRNGPFPYMFSDVRVDYGSCATIIWEYFFEEKVLIDKNLATALLMGIMMDTAFMTRGVSPIDLKAYSNLFFQADWELSSSILKNSLSVKDLGVFKEAIRSYKLFGSMVFIVIRKSCTSEVQALVTDYFLTLQEVRVAVTVTKQGKDYRISVRSEDKDFPSDGIIYYALKDIGEGGGHVHMGGGMIPGSDFPGMYQLESRFRKALKKL